MRIAFITPFYAPEWKFGGPPRKISGLAREITARGHVIRVVTFHSERSNDRSEHAVDSINVQYLPWIGSQRWQCPTSLQYLRDEIEAASIVHCYGLYNLICPTAAIMAYRRSKPFLIEPMGMFVPRVRRFVLKRSYNVSVTRWLFRHSASVIATSQLEADELRGAVAANKVEVRSNGVILQNLQDCRAPSRLRDEWGVGRDGQLIGYIGRISEKKGLLELIEAFSALPLSNTKLLVAGPVSEPAYLDRLKRAAHSSPRRGDILFTGLLEGDRYVETLHALDLFVLPSVNENFGNSAAEAVLANVPVLLTHDCGVAPIIDGRVGMAVGQSVEALCRGLEKMLEPETRKCWDPHWKQVQSELSWDRPAQVMEQIYRRVAHEQGIRVAKAGWTSSN